MKKAFCLVKIPRDVANQLRRARFPVWVGSLQDRVNMVLHNFLNPETQEKESHVIHERTRTDTETQHVNPGA
jgi:hypothetical protein